MAAVVLLALLFVAGVWAEGPVVRIPHGALQGSWKVSTGGRTYASFQGVPYARPPVGKYRFREPQQLKPWLGVWDATRKLSECIQYEPFKKHIIGSENCLYVNVFSPKLTPGANLPVLVYIHGGAFMYGEGALYDPSHLMDKDLIVVTMNYRLGPIGFLSTGDEIIPGNMGLKDQSFALHWVRNNIMLFGGNPDAITLSGCSAGGASVNYQYLSPLSRGTFQRGIAWSGAAFASWTHAAKPAQKAKALAAIVGCPTGTSREILDCLKYRPAEVIVNAQIEMLEWKVHMFTPFTPTTEAANVRNPFLTQYPYHAARTGAMMNIPLITSITSEEGLYPAAVYQTEPGMLAEIEANWETLASNLFEYNDTLPLNQRAEVAAKIKQKYLGNKPVSQETFSQLVKALGDRLFNADVGRLAQIHALKSGQPVHVYRYTYQSTTSLSNAMANNDAVYGVSHADDVLRIFNFMVETRNAEEKEMTNQLVDLVYSYAATGIPKIGDSSWTPVKPGSPNVDYLEISGPNKLQMKSDPDFGNRSFWDGLGFIENDNYHLYIKDEL